MGSTASGLRPDHAWGLEVVVTKNVELFAGNDLAEWIRSARAGSAEALGRLLEACRPYLLLVANRELPAELRGKAGASDLVQESFLEAQDNFGRFRDDGEAELLAWLRAILRNNVADLRRRYCGTEKRRLNREVALPDGSGGGAAELPALVPSPSSVVAAREQDDALHEALGRLPEEYRRVVAWRNYDRLPFDEIGRRTGRSAEAARKLWVRALERLEQLLEACDDT
jgi:RNA polymerase sigma-70 factor, ECF subfamily